MLCLNLTLSWRPLIDNYYAIVCIQTWLFFSDFKDMAIWQLLVKMWNVFLGVPPLAPSNEGNQEKLLPHDSQWPQLLSTFFCVEPRNLLKVSYLAQFQKMLSKFLYVIFNYNFQQVTNSNRGSNMTPLMVSREGHKIWYTVRGRVKLHL